MRIVSVTLAVLLALWQSAIAADFTAKPVSDGVAIFITGPIVEGDDSTFRNLVAGYDKALVVLSSRGGKIFPAMNIGALIQSKHFNTVVPDGDVCASACALIWLGGAVRFMAADLHIGFHAAYTKDENGDTAVTGQGNAVIGAYLAHLGLPYRAVRYATEASPDQMAWLSLQDAQDKGIEVRLFQADLPGRPDPPVRMAEPVSPPRIAAIGPSFDCSRADTPKLRFICADPDLMRIDLAMVQPYYVLRHQVGPPGWQALLVEAIDFQHATEQVCGIDPSGTLPADLATLKICVYTAYNKERTVLLSRLSGTALQEASRSIEQHVALQARLQALGYIPATEKIDGIYGTGTRAAIVNWQTSASLTPTGLLGDSDASALLQSGLMASTEASHPSSEPTVFADGLRDRRAWETWYEVTVSDYRVGATYWAGQRSLPHPGSCLVLSGDARNGCLAAATRLAASDARRKAEPDYRRGWNSYIP